MIQYNLKEQMISEGENFDYWGLRTVEQDKRDLYEVFMTMLNKLGNQKTKEFVENFMKGDYFDFENDEGTYVLITMGEEKFRYEYACYCPPNEKDKPQYWRWIHYRY